VQSQPVKAKPVTLKLVPQPGVIVGTKEVVAALKRPDGRILDARSLKEFMGEDIGEGRPTRSRSVTISHRCSRGAEAHGHP
jgi:3-mercaptopyruvate sulfurtransferase SseA